eukprot:1140892-Pelagomonas_calceolata.AAC.7
MLKSSCVESMAHPGADMSIRSTFKVNITGSFLLQHASERACAQLSGACALTHVFARTDTYLGAALVWLGAQLEEAAMEGSTASAAAHRRCSGAMPPWGASPYALAAGQDMRRPPPQQQHSHWRGGQLRQQVLHAAGSVGSEGVPPCVTSRVFAPH